MNAHCKGYKSAIYQNVDKTIAFKLNGLFQTSQYYTFWDKVIVNALTH